MTDEPRDERPAPDTYLSTHRGQEALAYQLEKLFGEKPRLDPAVATIDILKRELPGFEAGISGGRDTILIRWRMKLGAELGLDSIAYLAPRDERDVYMIIRPIIEQARAHAVRDFGLDAIMREREVDAYERGHRAGVTEGRAAGIEEGRREAIREYLAALAHEEGESDE